MANFDFLAREDDIEDEDEPMGDETDDGFSPAQIVKKADLGELGVDTDTEDVLKEFNFLTQPGNQEDSAEKGAEWSGGGEWGVAKDAAGGVGAASDQQAGHQGNLELGELAVPSEATIHFKALSTAGQVNQHFDLSIASAQAETVTWYNLIVGEFKGMS